MTRWQRFRHLFELCCGPVLKRQYFGPKSGKLTFNSFDAERLLAEATYGVTLLHCRCSKCGKRWTNRELGDWRETTASSSTGPRSTEPETPSSAAASAPDDRSDRNA